MKETIKELFRLLEQLEVESDWDIRERIVLNILDLKEDLRKIADVPQYVVKYRPFAPTKDNCQIGPLYSSEEEALAVAESLNKYLDFYYVEEA